MKKQKRMPLLLISLLASMLFVSLASSVSAYGIYQEYYTGDFSQPSVAVLMQGLSHHVYPWSFGNPNGASGNTQLADKESALSSMPPDSDPPAGPSGSGSAAVITAGDPGSESSGNASDIHPTSDETGNAAPDAGPTDTAGSGQPPQNTPDSGSVQPDPSAMPEPSAQPEEPQSYEFTEVGQDYFDDALFIGDSRAVGIQLYSGWDNLTYYVESGMTVYNMFNRQITDKDGSDTTIEEALKVHTFGKIYLEIGINEMGTGTVDSFMEAYENAVLHLRELQPEADLFLCGIMYVRQSKSDSDPIFNNPGIKERNERIAALADGKTVFYLDINEVTSDETGNLNPDYTWDEVHLLGKYNVLWTDYLSSHGIIKDKAAQ